MRNNFFRGLISVFFLFIVSAVVAGIFSNYHSSDMIAEAVNDQRAVSCLCSRRWILAYISFFGYFFMYTTRVNMSVAVLCMVKSNLINMTNTVNHTHPVSNATPDLKTGYGECGQLDSSSSLPLRGEFDWDKPIQSRILAVYFYGYIIMQIPGGWLAGRYGGRRVLGVALSICGLCTLLTPVATRTSLYLLYVLRFIIGVASGVTFPTVHSMWGRWAPPLERSKLMSFGLAGGPAGTIATFALSGYLCVYGIDNGWGSIFYVFGSGTLLWVVLWLWLTADSPRDSTRITEAELEYIETSIGGKSNKHNLSTPWGPMLKSRSVWGIVAANVSFHWMNYTLLTGLPTFMKESLKFDIQQNGGLSALPYLCAATSGMVSGQVADLLRSRTSLSTASVRKIFTVVSLATVASFLVGATYITCDKKYLAVILLCLAVSGTGTILSGFAINHVDIAPRYAGVLFGITNTIGTIPGMASPLLTGALTPNRTTEEWRNVFFVCAAFAASGAILFSIFAKGEVQEWAKHSGDKPEDGTYRYIQAPKSGPSQ